MAEHVRAFFPLWQRGMAGFKAEPLVSGGWGWRYLDLNGYAIYECPLRLESEAEALDDCARYWRQHSRHLQAVADARERKGHSRVVAPEFKP